MDSKSDHPVIKTNIGLICLAWSIGGGWKGVFKSFDFYLAILICLISFNYWINHQWWVQVIDVIPSLLGFTLGGFAIFLGFGSESFKEMLAEDENVDKSPYVSVSAAFLYFTIMQMTALLCALVANAMHFETPLLIINYKVFIYYVDIILSGVGYFIFIYSIILTLRAALRIFRLSRWYAWFLASDKNRR